MRLARWLRRPIVWAPVSLLLLAFVAWRSRLWEAGDRLGTVDVIPILGAVALNALVLALWAVRSAHLLRSAGAIVPVLPLVPMTAFANTINNLTPGSSGEVFRLWLLHAHHGVPYATGGAIIAIERLGALGWLSGSALLAWLAWIGVLPPLVALGLLAALIVLPAAVYGLGLRPLAILARAPAGPLLGPDRWSRTQGWLGRVDATIARLVTRPAPLATFAATTALILAANTAQLILVGRALGVEVAPAAAWGALGLAITAGVLSLLPFGLGSTDLVLATLLTVAGVPPVLAAAMTFGFRIVATLPLGLAGVASYAVLSAGLPPGEALAAARDAAAGEALAEPDSTTSPAGPSPERGRP